MANGYPDENGVKTKTGTLQSDGSSIIRILCNESTGAALVSNGTSGTYHGKPWSQKDDNDYPVIMLTSAADGKTPIRAAVDANGNLLIKST